MSAAFEDITTARNEGGGRPPRAPAGRAPFWGDSPESWDTVTLASTDLPGVCSVSGRVARRVDKKTSSGRHATTVTYLGDDPAEFTITVKLWTEEHLLRFEALLDALSQLGPVVDSKDWGKFPRRPVDVRHPALDLLKIRACHVVEAGMLQPASESGVFEATFKCVEYVGDAQKKTGVTTPKGADSSILSRGPGAIGRRLVRPSTTNGRP